MKMKKILLVFIIISSVLLAQSNILVYITNSGKKYHREYCRTTRNKETYTIKLKEAEAKGYTACKVCNPY